MGLKARKRLCRFGAPTDTGGPNASAKGNSHPIIAINTPAAFGIPADPGPAKVRKLNCMRVQQIARRVEGR
jgi:hypothetical protein